MAYMDTLTGRNTQRQLALFYNIIGRRTGSDCFIKKIRPYNWKRPQRQRQLLLGTLVGMALVSGLLFLAYRNNRQKQRKCLLQQQKTEIQRRSEIIQALVELKTTQNQLIQSEKWPPGELTAGIAHEIHTPQLRHKFAEVSIELIDELADEQAKAHLEPRVGS